MSVVLKIFMALFLFIPNLQAQLVSEEIAGFFAQMSTVGQSPTNCLEGFSPADYQVDEDPRDFHQKIKFDIKEIEKTTFNGHEVSVVSYEDAQKLFELFSQIPYMPTKYLEDGCYARAHELMLIAQNNGLELGKAFIEPPNRGYPLLYPKKLKEGASLDKSFAGWKYHANAFVMVKKDGVLTPMVFDIGAADSLQSFDQWKKNLSTKPEEVKITTRQKDYVFAEGNYNSPNKSIIHNLISTQELIDEIGMDEYNYRVERGWL